MARIQNILVGVDLAHGDRLASPELGPEAQAAVVEALRLAGAWDGNVTFVSVLEDSKSDRTRSGKCAEDRRRRCKRRLVKTCQPCKLTRNSR